MRRTSRLPALLVPLALTLSLMLMSLPGSAAGADDVRIRLASKQQLQPRMRQHAFGAMKRSNLAGADAGVDTPTSVAHDDAQHPDDAQHEAEAQTTVASSAAVTKNRTRQTTAMAQGRVANTTSAPAATTPAPTATTVAATSPAEPDAELERLIDVLTLQRIAQTKVQALRDRVTKPRYFEAPQCGVRSRVGNAGASGLEADSGTPAPQADDPVCTLKRLR